MSSVLDRRIERFKTAWNRPTLRPNTEEQKLVVTVWQLIDERESRAGWHDASDVKPAESGMYLCVKLYPTPHVDVTQFLEYHGFVAHVVAWKPLPEIPDYVKQWLVDNVVARRR